MPQSERPSSALKYVVGSIFVCGVAFGAVTAWTAPEPKGKTDRPLVAQATTPTATVAEPASVVEPEQAPEAKPEPRKRPKPKPRVIELTPPPAPKMTPPKQEVEPKPEMKAETTPETKPEVKPEPKTEPKPEVKPEPSDSSTTAVTFNEVKGILQSRCASCHGDPLIKAKIDVRSLAAIGAKKGLVVPGKPEESDLWGAIEFESMPPADKPQLTPAQKMKIKAWILAGAK